MKFPVDVYARNGEFLKQTDTKRTYMFSFIAKSTGFGFLKRRHMALLVITHHRYVQYFVCNELLTIPTETATSAIFLARLYEARVAVYLVTLLTM